MNNLGVPDGRSDGTATTNSAAATSGVDFDPADFVTELHDGGLWPINAGGDPQVPDSTTGAESEADHLKVYLMST
jgi:hypothetical protein